MLSFFRATTIFLLLVFLSFIFCIVFLFRPFHRDNGHLISQVWGPMVIKILGVQVTFDNAESLQDSFPSVTIGNHQHNIDFFLFSYFIPKGTLSLMKHTLIWIPFFGWVYWLAGHFLINKKNHISALKTMNKVKQRMGLSEVSVLIMPEGTRSKGRGLGRFKKGAFHLAIETQCPIQPIVVSSYHKFLNFNRWKSGEIFFHALMPISTVGKTMADLDNLIEEVREVMLNGISRLDLELSEKLAKGQS